MSAVIATETLIKPHGGSLVDRTGERPDDLDSLEAHKRPTPRYCELAATLAQGVAGMCP